MSKDNVRRLAVEVEDLLFDPENPRLPPEVDKSRQESILSYLVLQIGVEDVLSSIAAIGFISGDPVIVRKAETDGKYYVIEGNRRLAALKLLSGHQIPRGPKLPELDREVQESLRKIEVQIGWNSGDLVSYLGYKHVTAAKEWGPEAKARFVVAHTNNDFTDAALRKFAGELGTKLPTLKRWLVAYFAIEQAKKKDLLEMEPLSDQLVFGTFYTLLGSSHVKEFVGLRPDDNLQNPIGNIENFREFLTWVVGSSNGGPVINSRDQKELGRVLADEEALAYFRSHKDLRAALRYVRASRDEVAHSLKEARFLVDNVLPVVADHQKDDRVAKEFSLLKRSIANAERLFEAANE